MMRRWLASLVVLARNCSWSRLTPERKHWLFHLYPTAMVSLTP
jgi:hypothetical protein